MREELDNIINNYKLVERTLEDFWKNYDNYLDEEPSESKEFGLIDRNSINIELYGYSFCVSNELDFDSIKVYIDFFLKGEPLRLGTYWCVYNLNGDLFDDYFVIE